MSAESDYVSSEAANVHRSAKMIEELLAKDALTQYEVIALGKLLQDVYTGLERILRTLCESKGIKAKKTESWHKDLLLAAKEASLITPPQFEAFRNLLLFRHMQIHGYGFMLDEKRLRQLGKPVPTLCRDFLAKLT
ncbi:MAG: hypothetical protein KAY65_04725 [Planctomycetes bacterium]|nr:hypothetical protein [Planctomycetota bacterium]